MPRRLISWVAHHVHHPVDNHAARLTCPVSKTPVQCWASVCDAGSALSRRFAIVQWHQWSCTNTVGSCSFEKKIVVQKDMYCVIHNSDNYNKLHHPKTAFARMAMVFCRIASQPTQNICVTVVQCWSSVEDVGLMLYKCYTYGLCLLGWLVCHSALRIRE